MIYSIYLATSYTTVTDIYISYFQGSVAGGFLAQPASKYSVLQVPFFCQFPYVLPCLVGGSISVLSLVGKYVCQSGLLNVGILQVLMSANPQMLSSTVAFMFLDETLHTKKKKKKSQAEQVSDQSDCSQSADIEMKKQGSGGRTETNDSEIEMNGTASLIAESDIDSQSDFEIVSAESSDVELLVRVPQHNKRRRWITKVKNAPSKAAERAKEELHHYRQQCISCVMWCTQCKCECSVEKTKSFVMEKSKAGLCKLKMMLGLLRDRRVLLSTGLYGLLGFTTVLSNEVCQRSYCDMYS